MISVVIPVYNEEGNVIPLHTELKEVLSSLSQKYEIIFIDDGSTDNTLTNLRSLIEKGEKNLRIIQLRKRFEKSAALVAGFSSTTGDIIITLDGDGQDDPQNIPLLLETLTEEIDVVCGWRKERKDSFLFKKLPSWIYNKLNRIFNKVKLHDSDCMLRVYRKEAISEIILLGGDHRYIPAILLNRGFKFAEVKVNHRRRISGKTKYGIKRIFTGFSDFITFRFLFRYGRRPMRLFSSIGIISILLALASGIYLLVVKYGYGKDIGTRSLLFLTVFFSVAGFQFLFTGFLAELIVRQKTTASSLYSIKQVYENKQKNIE